MEPQNVSCFKVMPKNVIAGYPFLILLIPKAIIVFVKDYLFTLDILLHLEIED